jgi:hypothetical protein
LRGLPFGQPPFLAFSAMAASLAGLFDLPPSLPICEYHFRTAGDGANFVFIVSCLVCPQGLDRSRSRCRPFDLECDFPYRHWNNRNAASGCKSELGQPLALQSDFWMSLAPEEIPGNFDLYFS